MTLRHGRGPRQPHMLFRELLQSLDANYPAPQFQWVYVVMDDDKIH